MTFTFFSHRYFQQRRNERRIEKARRTIMVLKNQIIADIDAHAKYSAEQPILQSEEMRPIPGEVPFTDGAA